MKPITILLVAIASLVQGLHAQVAANIYRKDLPVIYISRGVSLHIISPEPITYVDISTDVIAGDLPVENILRLKIKSDIVLTSDKGIGVVTIVGESFIAQYDLQDAINTLTPVSAQVNILPEHTKPLDVSGINLTGQQMKIQGLAMLGAKRGKTLRKTKAYGMEARLNHIYTIGDDVFLDLTYHNTTNLPYEIDELRFKIEDKKITKATNIQSIEIKPVWQLYPLAAFKKSFRNIYVLKKATFPQNKILNIELTEKQISGRVITLSLKYKDILKADTF